MSTYHLDLVNGNDANSGADWANAWLTVSTGAGAGDIAPTDLIKIAKTPDPVSIGTCQWADLSKTVTRTGVAPAGSETLAIDDCESGWVAANSATVTHPTTDMKLGAARLNVTKATYATGTLYAYKALAAPLDLSGFEAISGWIYTDAAIADATRWVIDLCSDAAGATPVDSFAVEAIPVSGALPFRYERVGGGALGAAINSIAIRSGAAAPAGGQDIGLDNVIACNDFSHVSLISKSGSAVSTNEGACGLQAINGTALTLDSGRGFTSANGQGYSGTTEEVTTYRRETFKTALGVFSVASEVNDSGADGAPITFSGGWNTATDEQDGETFLDGRQGATTGLQISSKSFVNVERLSLARYNTGLNMATAIGCVIDIGCVCNSGIQPVDLGAASYHNTLTVASVNNNGITGSGGAVLVSGDNNVVRVGSASNNGSSAHSGLRVSAGADGNDVEIDRADNNAGYAAQILASIFRGSISGRANTTASILATTAQQVHLHDSVLAGATEVVALTAYRDARVYSHNHDDSGDHRIYTDGGQIDIIDTDFDAPATAKMTQLAVTSATRSATYPLDLGKPGVDPRAPLEFAVVANKLVTIKAIMRKSHATDVDGWLVCWGGQIAGVVADAVAAIPDTTDEEEVTLTFTPTEAGVVKIGVRAAYVAGTGNVCIDRFTTIEQAA